MTMHVVLGDGEMTRREMTEALGDIWKHDELEEQPFWFLIQAKSEPTDTDKSLVTWLEKNGIYYEIICDDADGIDPLYSMPQETHVAQKLSPKVISLMQSKPEGDEPAEVLALFASSDPNAAEDRWLNGVIQAAFDEGFPIRALNDGLVEIDLSDDAAAAEAEPEEEALAEVTPIKAVAKKSVAKKAAAKPADIPVSEEDTASSVAAPAVRVPSRDELEDMEPSEVKEIAASLGIVLPPRTRATTYIDHILGEAKVSEVATAEVTAVMPPEVAVVNTNGQLEADDIAERVADILWERFSKAFAQA